MATIRDYSVIKYAGGDYTAHCTLREDLGKTIYAPIPTPEEASNALEEEIKYIRLASCFNGFSLMEAIPKVDFDYVSNVYGLCKNVTSLKVAPSIGKNAAKNSMAYAFNNCSSLISPAVIPTGAQSRGNLYSGCTSLPYPVSIPNFSNTSTSNASIASIYKGCSNMTGEMIVRPKNFMLTSMYSDALKNTVKPITLYGDKTMCEKIAATANNGNASWSAWYDPIPAVTDRGQGSYTTADDITRMVRNGALAVSSYAPGRMVYHQGDIVRADEWAALVEAAQTIDPTITLSTNYDNLNRIEAAFDSAL